MQAERANVTANVLHPGCIDTNVGKAEIPLLRNKYVEGKSEQIIPRASQISYKFVAYNNRLSSSGSSGSRHERREKNLQTQLGFGNKTKTTWYFVLLIRQFGFCLQICFSGFPQASSKAFRRYDDDLQLLLMVWINFFFNMQTKLQVLSLDIHVSCTYTLCLSCFLFLSFMQCIDHTFCFFLLLSPKTAVLGENVRFLSCFLFLSFMQSIDHTFCFFLLISPKTAVLGENVRLQIISLGS